MAAELIEERKPARPMEGTMLRWAVPAVLAMAVSLFVVFSRQPEDTFKTPEQAYAEVERAFSMISEKIELGSDIVRSAEEPLQLIQTVFK